MNDPSTLREALLAEALGDMAALMDRMQALLIATEDSRVAVLQLHNGRAGQVRALENRMKAATEHAKVEAAKYIARRTVEGSRSAIEAQTRALEEAGRELFRSELGPALRSASMPLHHVAEMARRGANPWHAWLTHAATAVMTAACALALAVWQWP